MYIEKIETKLNNINIFYSISVTVNISRNDAKVMATGLLTADECTDDTNQFTIYGIYGTHVTI